MSKVNQAILDAEAAEAELHARRHQRKARLYRDLRELVTAYKQLVVHAEELDAIPSPIEKLIAEMAIQIQTAFDILKLRERTRGRQRP